MPEWTPEQVEAVVEATQRAAASNEGIYLVGLAVVALLAFLLGWLMMGEALQRMENRH